MEDTNTMWRLGYRLFGRTYIEAFDRERGAAGYIAKYVTKSLADYDLWTREHGYSTENG